MSTATCNKCEVEQSIDEFHRDSRYKNGIVLRCRSCKAADARAYHYRYYEKNKAKMRDKYAARMAAMAPEEKQLVRRKAKLSAHGVSLEWYESALKAQNYGCAICGTTDPGKPSFSVDHDHNCCPGTNGCAICVRGLLCDPCNNAIGRMQDDPARLRAAADYLERQQ